MPLAGQRMTMLFASAIAILTIGRALRLKKRLIHDHSKNFVGDFTECSSFLKKGGFDNVFTKGFEEILSVEIDDKLLEDCAMRTCLGAGREGVVYKANFQGKDVVAKFLIQPSSGYNNAETIQSFGGKEADYFVKPLQSGRAVVTVQVKTPSSFPYMSKKTPTQSQVVVNVEVYELFLGRTISHIAKMSSPELLMLKEQLVHAIAWLMAHEWTHDDLNQDNVMWDGRNLKIIDPAFAGPLSAIPGNDRMSNLNDFGCENTDVGWVQDLDEVRSEGSRGHG